MENLQSAGSEHTLSFSSSLLCQEGQTSLDDEGFEEKISITQDDDEYVQMLIDREINGDGLQKLESADIISGNWIKAARLDAIQYILNTWATFGFKIQTAYLAVTYLDRFLSRRLIEAEKYWALRLLAMACLSLAAKMEECRVPMLSEFPGEDYNFESRVIQRMELLVLDTLDWRMGLVTPFAFTHYFVSKFCENPPMRDIVFRIFEVILVAIRADDKLMHHKPSAIAAAATLLILDQRLTRESLEHKINALTSRGCLKIEDVVSFYNQMKELNVEKSEFPNTIMSPLLSPTELQRSDALENSSVTSTVGANRKRLTFVECDQNTEMRDNKRQC